jgi:hypothetical protein
MIKRIFIYLLEMFPLSSVIASFLSGSMVISVLWKLEHRQAHFIPVTLLGCVSLILFSLLLRVMDEFKDYQDDLKNFPQRPLPSGRVHKTDLKVLGGVILMGIVLLNVWDEMVLLSAFGVLLYSLGMLLWFGMEKKIRSSLPLALATHHPIVLIHFLYLFCVYETAFDEVTLRSFVTVLPLALIMTNWELSRKMKFEADENNYTTYSKIWGRIPSALLCLSLQVVILSASSWILWQLQTPWLIFGAYVVAFVSTMIPYVRYLANKPINKNLKLWSEAQILLVLVTINICAWISS